CSPRSRSWTWCWRCSPRRVAGRGSRTSATTSPSAASCSSSTATGGCGSPRACKAWPRSCAGWRGSARASGARRCDEPRAAPRRAGLAAGAAPAFPPPPGGAGRGAARAGAGGDRGRARPVARVAPAAGEVPAAAVAGRGRARRVRGIGGRAGWAALAVPGAARGRRCVAGQRRARRTRNTRRGRRRMSARWKPRPEGGGRPATLPDVARHIHTFAATILDRIFLLSGELHRFAIEVHGLPALVAHLDAGRGVLLFGSHLGSFEALRVLAATRPDIGLRVVL